MRTTPGTGGEGEERREGAGAGDGMSAGGSRAGQARQRQLVERFKSMWRRRESREYAVASVGEAAESSLCRMSNLPVSGPGHGPRACGSHR